MTAQIMQFPVRRSPEATLREAFEAFEAAAVTSVVPAPLVHACQLGDGAPTQTRVCGTPVTVTVTGAMAPGDIVDTYRRLRTLAPAAGARIRIAGGRVLVCPPSLEGVA